MGAPANGQAPKAWIFRALAAAFIAACTTPSAHAVVTFFTTTGNSQRSITLRVGSNDTAVNTVTFDVVNANVAPSPTPVQGTPGNGAPTTSPTGGIEIRLSTVNRGAAPDVVRLLADSSAGLACVTGGCGSTLIPFSTISWVSNNLQGGANAGKDIPSGNFNGSATQQLVSLTVPAGSDSVTITNVLVFTYDNATLYPSGIYNGRVTYTATVP
jgi:hypothetical protein